MRWQWVLSASDIQDKLVVTVGCCGLTLGSMFSRKWASFTKTDFGYGLDVSKTSDRDVYSFVANSCLVLDYLKLICHKFRVNKMWSNDNVLTDVANFLWDCLGLRDTLLHLRSSVLFLREGKVNSLIGVEIHCMHD